MTMILGQINTEPMVSQIGMLSVVEAPDILYNQVKRLFFRFICFFSLPSIVAPDILYNQVERYFFSYVVFLFRNFSFSFHRRHLIFFTTSWRDIFFVFVVVFLSLIFSFYSIDGTRYSLQPGEEMIFYNHPTFCLRPTNSFFYEWCPFKFPFSIWSFSNALLAFDLFQMLS